MLKFTLLFLSLFTIACFSQTKSLDTIAREAKIVPVQNKNTFEFQSQKPVLDQIAGAPKAFYSHYWEFGDGNFSTKENPKHTYKNPGEYEVNLWATNNYDSGKTPATRPQKVKTNDTADTSQNEVQLMEDDIVLSRNREPLPEEEFVIIMSYKNEKDYVTNGKIHFYYNEKEFKNDNFDLMETRVFYNENVQDLATDLVFNDNFDDNNAAFASSENVVYQTQKFQDTTVKKNLFLSLEEAKQKFKNGKTITFNNLNPKEQRNIFFTLRTTPKMIKDTSAILKVRSIYVPDDNYVNHKIKDMEMEIVTSHDPNKMSTSGMFINYRLVRFKRVNFKTRFQNNGEGPATTIRLETDVPDMYDKSTLEIEGMHPECPICPKDKEVRYSCLDTIISQKQIIFTFKNVYLPGSEQKNVKEKDSTKGFVKYSLKFGNDFHKIKTKSRTAIIFDKNDPVITNYSTTRFNPGISIGAKAGYNYYPDLNNAKSYFAGATVSPFKSYRWYWQAELMLNKMDYANANRTSELTMQEFDPPIEVGVAIPIFSAFKQTETSSQISRTLIDIVPISARYNVNNFIGLGFGPQFSTTLASKTDFNEQIKYYTIGQAPEGGLVPKGEIEQLRTNESYSENQKTEIHTQVFADVTLGFARSGPSLGVRYYKNFKTDFDSWQFYAIWKF